MGPEIAEELDPRRWLLQEWNIPKHSLLKEFELIVLQLSVFVQRYNLNDVDPAAIGLSVANGQMFYASFEVQSNVWLAERREPTAR